MTQTAENIYPCPKCGRNIALVGIAHNCWVPGTYPQAYKPANHPPNTPLPWIEFSEAQPVQAPRALPKPKLLAIAVHKPVVHKDDVVVHKDGRYLDAEKRKAYRREWTRKRREAKKLAEEGKK